MAGNRAGDETGAWTQGHVYVGQDTLSWMGQGTEKVTKMVNGKINMTGKKDMCSVEEQCDHVRGQLNESGLGSENDF